MMAARRKQHCPRSNATAAAAAAATEKDGELSPQDGDECDRSPTDQRSEECEQNSAARAILEMVVVATAGAQQQQQHSGDGHSYGSVLSTAPLSPAGRGGDALLWEDGEGTTIVSAAITALVGLDRSPLSIRCHFCSQGLGSLVELQTHTITAHIPLALLHTTHTLLQQFNQTEVDREECQSTAQVDVKSADAPPLVHCSHCSASFSDDAVRLTHILSAHVAVPRRIWNCTVCTLDFDSPNKLEQHLAEKHVDSLYRCSPCGRLFERKQEITDHQRSSHSSQSTSTGCSLCSQSFDDIAQLAIHFHLAHHKINDSTAPPSATPTAPKSRGYAKRTAKRAAAAEETAGRVSPTPPQRLMKCSVCDERCLGEEALDEHRLHAHCKVRRATRCADCHEPIGGVGAFVRHTTRHAVDFTTGEQQLMCCCVCRQSIRGERQLMLHASFHCAQPDSDDHPSGAAEQQTEMGVDAEEKTATLEAAQSTPAARKPVSPYRCRLCQLTFNSAVRLANHKRKHMTDHSFVCQICDARLHSRDELIDHMAAHKGALNGGKR